MPGTIKHELGFTISGKCVICSTFVTLTPAASKLDAVPPVEIIENLQEQNLCISGTKIATFEKKKAIHVYVNIYENNLQRGINWRFVVNDIVAI